MPQRKLKLQQHLQLSRKKMPHFPHLCPDPSASSLAGTGWGLRSPLALCMFASSLPFPWPQGSCEKMLDCPFHISELGWKNNLLLKQVISGNRTFLLTHSKRWCLKQHCHLPNPAGKIHSSKWKQGVFFKLWIIIVLGWGGLGTEVLPLETKAGMLIGWMVLLYLA